MKLASLNLEQKQLHTSSLTSKERLHQPWILPSTSWGSQGGKVETPHRAQHILLRSFDFDSLVFEKLKVPDFPSL